VNLDEVAFVFISVDSERDNPGVVKKYLNKFSARFIGLTSDLPNTRIVAKQFSAAFYKGNPSNYDGHYDVSHSTQTFVLDAAGMLRAEFYSPPIDTMSSVINVLLDENKNPHPDQE
jgi:protein SCO1/2